MGNIAADTVVVISSCPVLGFGGPAIDFLVGKDVFKGVHVESEKV